MNVNMTGVYRVHYDSDTWQALIRQLHTNHEVSCQGATFIHYIFDLQLLIVNMTYHCSCRMVIGDAVVAADFREMRHFELSKWQSRFNWLSSDLCALYEYDDVWVIFLIILCFAHCTDLNSTCRKSGGLERKLLLTLVFH